MSVGSYFCMWQYFRVGLPKSASREDLTSECESMDSGYLVLIAKPRGLQPLSSESRA
eukprot:CAMPEP_0178384446 /NCGR_PEP_ID=MMETSP0689_2-20121128/7518_1 /TAXON_ID=160604 /ORGANISM="Amphidinium massartii, Strain CS-259" /LENGTH=56 /DNA_ID=CAMNT_0020004691 /DNA_START=44 /DNA_END=210 /DNA_ORIENTATION=+